ncbi:hypothetical protein C8R44DRAFT_579497, partial [Mycena epipterygia]
PFSRFGILPFGGRSTAVCLSAGDVWVVASTALTHDTKAAIDRLGPVKWIMAVDSMHHIFWKVYPEAKVIGVEGIAEKKQEEGWNIDGGEHHIFFRVFQAPYFAGFANKDGTWFHASSKMLTAGDLLFNLPGKEQACSYSKSKSSSKVPIVGSLDPWGSLHKHFVWGQRKDKVAMKRNAETVLGWCPKRIIMCHG